MFKTLFGIDRWRTLQRIGAILLLVSLCWPMSSCENVAPNAPGEPAKTPAPRVTEYHYVWTPAQAADPSAYLRLSAFVWPAVLAFALKPPLRRRWRWLILAAEFLLVGWTGFILFWLAYVVTPERGAYIAASALSLLLIAWLGEVVRMVRTRPDG